MVKRLWWRVEQRFEERMQLEERKTQWLKKRG